MNPSARLRLAAELAVGLARRLWMTLRYDATDAGFCWHQAQNPFEDGCYVLWELGVAWTGADFHECGTYVDDLVRKSHRMPPHRPRR